jgi:hypothetical protein
VSVAELALGFDTVQLAGVLRPVGICDDAQQGDRLARSPVGSSSGNADRLAASNAHTLQPGTSGRMARQAPIERLRREIQQDSPVRMPHQLPARQHRGEAGFCRAVRMAVKSPTLKHALGRHHSKQRLATAAQAYFWRPCKKGDYLSQVPWKLP